MRINENKKIVEDFYQASGRGDVETLYALLADDLRWTSVGSTKFSGTFVGKEAIVQNMLAAVFAIFKNGIKTTLDRLTAEGDVVVVQLRGEAETKDGRPYNQSYCHIFGIRDGKIREVTEYLDTELCTQILAG